MVLDSPYPSRISNDLVGISQCGQGSKLLGVGDTLVGKTLKRFRVERIMKVHTL